MAGRFAQLPMLAVFGRCRQVVQPAVQMSERCREVEQNVQHHGVLVYVMVCIEMLRQATEDTHERIQLGLKLRLYSRAPHRSQFQ